MPLRKSLVLIMAMAKLARGVLRARGSRAGGRSEREGSREPREDPAAVERDDHGVLGADATDALEIDTRLDRDHAQLAQRSRGRPTHVGGLVDLETDAVTGAVGELWAPAGGLDHVSGGGVDRLGVDTGPNRLPPCGLGPADQVVELGLGRRR